MAILTKLQLVIFDCDGVMFDSKEANRRYYNEILGQFHHPEMDAEELQYVHVHHAADSIRHIFRKYPADYQAAEAYRATVDYGKYLQYMSMEPDLIEFLEYLKINHRIAISTNRSNTMPTLLSIFGLEQYFEMVVTSLDVKRSKPHPEAMEKILGHFKMEADQAIYIGDSYIDRQHSAAVGMRLIAFKNPDLEAEFHVTNFMDITRL